MRIRTIKPEFYTHEMLFEVEREYSLPLRLAYTGLWCAADREGRFKWEPRRLGVQILPYDEIDFSRVLDALHTRGFIGKYEFNGNFFGFIPSFDRHQVINNRERESELPNPCDCDEIDASSTREPRETHATLTCTSGREGKGREHGKERNKEHGKDLSCPLADLPECLLIWSKAPAIGKQRSSKKQLAQQWKKIKHKPSIETLADALSAWTESQKWKDGYCEGIHIWVTNEQWDNLPEKATSSRTLSRDDRHPKELKEETDLSTLPVWDAMKDQ